MKRIICLMICLLLFLSGCWNRREPKNLSLISSALYDLKDDGIYKATLEVINPEAEGGPAGGGGNKSPVVTVTGEGNSLPEAIRHTSMSLERNLFAGQTLLRLFSEKLAKTDLVTDLDYFFRDPLTDENPLIVVVKGDNPDRIFTCKLGLSENLGNYIDNLRVSQHNFISRSVFVDSLTFMKDYLNEGKQPVAGVVEIVEEEAEPSAASEDESADSAEGSGDSASSIEEGKPTLKYSGLAAFKGKKLVGYMDGIEAGCYNILTNNMGNGIVNLNDGGALSVIRIASSKAEILPSFEDEKLKFEVKLRFKNTLIQASEQTDIGKADQLKKTEEQFNRQMEDLFEKVIQKAQTEFQSDIFGFGNAVHRKLPKQWKKLKETWDDTFSAAKVHVTVQSDIERGGQMKEPLLAEEKKQ